MEPSNDSFLALLEERISKRDGNSGEKLSQVAPLISKQPAPADNMSIFYTIGVRHSKSRTEIVWKMSWIIHYYFRRAFEMRSSNSGK